MSTRFPNSGLTLLFLVLVATAACDRAEVRVTAPAPASSGTAVQSSFTVEPLTVRPEFLQTASCVSHPAFGVRVVIIVGGAHDVILRELRFGFTDRFGGNRFPDVIAMPSLSAPVPPTSTLPTTSAIPFPGMATLPGASPIPIPGSSPVHGLFVPGGASRALPYYLRFACGVASKGTLLISAAAGDRSGSSEPIERSVRIGF